MSIYRKVVWYLKGKKEYTKPGYEAAAKYFNPTDLDVDYTGKSVMITGANSGIGKVAAKEVAKRGGRVHMVCRSAQRAEDAKQEIVSATGNDNVLVHILDMSRPKDVAKFATEFAGSGQNLNVLVNNAGCMVNEREKNEEGLEKNFATNTLGTYILTSKLIPLLLKSEKPRVITVTSGGMLLQKLDAKDLQVEKLNPFDGTMAYAQNKRQQVVMTEQWSKRFPDIHFSSVHPGWADTPAVQLSMPDFYEKMKGTLRTAEQGADAMVWLILAEAALKEPSGLFFQDRKAVSTHLPLAHTKSSAGDEELLMKQLDDMEKQFS